RGYSEPGRHAELDYWRGAGKVGDAMTKFFRKPVEPAERDPGPGWLRSRFVHARYPRSCVAPCGRSVCLVCGPAPIQCAQIPAPPTQNEGATPSLMIVNTSVALCHRSTEFPRASRLILWPKPSSDSSCGQPTKYSPIR